ncbi:hypothetical protein ANTQUA_LOCUS7529 [Anthophora quadrimaculata]
MTRRRRPPRPDSPWIYLLTWLLWIVLPVGTGVVYNYADKQRYDGWYNNLAHPDWGSIGKYIKQLCTVLFRCFGSVMLLVFKTRSYLV